MSFHLAIAATWALIILIGARSQGARAWPAARAALLIGSLSLGLSVGAEILLPEPTECFEQTPTGRGSC